MAPAIGDKANIREELRGYQDQRSTDRVQRNRGEALRPANFGGRTSTTNDRNRKVLGGQSMGEASYESSHVAKNGSPETNHPKEVLGLSPGGSLPGAFMVLRRARGPAPAWVRNNNGESDEELSVAPTVMQSQTSDSPSRHDQESLTFDEQYDHDDHSELPPSIKCVQKPQNSWKREYTALVIALGIFTIIACMAIVVTLTQVHTKNHSAATTPSTAEAADPCGMTGSQSNAHKQCACYGTVKVVAEDTLRQYEALQLTLFNDHDREDDLVTSCEHRNVALLLLASMNIASMSTEQLLGRYTLNLLYLVLNGSQWFRNEGWLDQNHANVCTWSGITCVEDTITGIDISVNFLEGTIMSELGLLTSLTALNLEGNSLSGAIPSEIGNLQNLQVFNVLGNKLNGTLPSELTKLTNLTHVSIGENSFTEDFSPFWNASALIHIDAADCGLSGSIPALQLGRMTSLTYLNLENNLMTNTIPTEIGMLTSLTTFAIFQNKFHGKLPSTIGELSRLEYMNVGFNYLTGSLPTELGRLTSLQSLQVHTNELNGKIPTEIGNCASLLVFIAENNSLSGTIPDDALGRLTKMKFLCLIDNGLFGTIPSESTTGLCELLHSPGESIVIELDCDVNCSCCEPCNQPF